MHSFFSIFVGNLKCRPMLLDPCLGTVVLNWNCEVIKSQHRILPPLKRDYRKLPRLAYDNYMEIRMLEFRHPQSVCTNPLTLLSSDFPSNAAPHKPFLNGWHSWEWSKPEAGSLLAKHLHPQAPDTHTPWVAMGVNGKAGSPVSWVLQWSTYVCQCA